MFPRSGEDEHEEEPVHPLLETGALGRHRHVGIGVLVVEEAYGAVVGEEIHAEDMLQRPGALVEKQCRRPSEELVDSAFQRPVVEGEVPKVIKQVETEDQYEKQSHVEVRLVALIRVKLFYALFVH